MNTDASWQEFAWTGNILRYLDYRQQITEQSAALAGEITDGYDRNTGAGAERNPVQGV